MTQVELWFDEEGIPQIRVHANEAAGFTAVRAELEALCERLTQEIIRGPVLCPFARGAASEEIPMDHESWKHYRKKHTQEMRAYIPGEDLDTVSVSAEDTPEAGGMIARNADNHADQWYVAAMFFAKNYEPAPFGANAIYVGPQNGG